jgi:uncharacterized protein YciI
MALFVIHWLDKAGGLPVRLATRQAHFDYIAAHPGVLKLGGPFLSDSGEMAGSLLIIEADDLAAAEAFAEGDPYKAAGLYERREVRPWKHTAGKFA